MRLSTAARALAAIALIAYPWLVWRGLRAGSLRAVALGVALVIAPAVILRLRARGDAGLALLPLLTATLLLIAAVLESRGLVLLVPIAINAVLGVAFGATLLRAGARPMIERFARLQEPELDQEKVAWCRTWTWIWCGFFAINGSVAALLAGLAPVAWWALYTGLVSYALIGALLALEWVLRVRRFPAVHAREARR